MKRALALGLVVLLCSSCEREARRFHDRNAAIPASAVRMSSITPGAPTQELAVRTTYEENAYAIAQGMRLFSYYNCVGCHSHGGGGMGPALMDDRWIYGSEPENIFTTIVEGRPNGMPSFAGKIPADRVWWIVAYVRSLSGLTPKGARPGRDDHMQYAKPPARLQRAERPRGSNPPQR